MLLVAQYAQQHDRNNSVENNMTRRLVSGLLALLVLAVSLGVVVTRADDRNTLVLVEPDDGVPEDLLAAPEVERIRELQGDALNFNILSGVSPDDRWLIVNMGRGPELMAIENGETIPLPPIDQSLGVEDVAQAVWRDQLNLSLLVSLQQKRNAALATLSLETGAWSVEELPFPARNVVEIAPNGSRVLLALREDAIRFQVYDLISHQFQDVGSVDLAYQTFVRASWNQDGSRLAYLLDTRPDRITSRSPEYLDGVLINSFVARDVLGRLPPAENPVLQRNEVRIYDFANQRQQVLAARNGDGAVSSDLSWSSNGQTLMVQVDYPATLKGRTYPSYAIPRAGALRFYTTDLQLLNEYPLTDPLAAASFVSPDEVIYQIVQGMNIELYYYNRVSGEVRKLSTDAGSYGLITGVISTRLSRQIIFDYSSFTAPFDLYRMRWEGGGLVRLTWTTEALRQSANLRQDPVSFKVGKQTYTGTLIQSKDAAFPPRNKPIVVWQEGGPLNAIFNSWGARVETPFATLPNAGFAVLVVPLQGRFGYGSANLLSLADNDNFGQIDIDTQADITRQMIARGWTSKGKIGITGCSYGGYFVLQSIIRHPDLYAAANAQCGLYDALTEWNRGYPDLMGLLQRSTPLERVDEFERDSPLYNSAKIRTPLLIFHGSEDFLPVTLAENFFQTVKDRGVPARMVKFMGAGHGIVPVNFELNRNDIENYLTYAAQEQIVWFRTYLKADTTPMSPTAK
ncbi:MAG: prolyl oligopeptidase family serine peptidase [Roseiflexaceae bacterium]